MARAVLHQASASPVGELTRAGGWEETRPARGREEDVPLASPPPLVWASLT